MQKHINEFLLRCSAINAGMSNPQSKSPAEKYAEAVEGMKKAKADYEALKLDKPHLLEKPTGINLKDKIGKYQIQIWELEEFKDSRPLSDSCMKMVDVVHREIFWNRREIVKTKFTKKGNIQEDETLSMYARVHPGRFTFLERNVTRFNNEFLTGMPDIQDCGLIVPTDLKTSWNMNTLPGPVKALDKKYEDQNFGYLDILKDGLKTDTWTTFYGLVNTPPVLIEQEIKREWWEMGCPDESTDEWMEICKEIEKRCIYDIERFRNDLKTTGYPYIFRHSEEEWTFDVPESERWVEIPVKWTQERQDEVYARVEEIRQYLLKAYPKHWIM